MPLKVVFCPLLDHGHCVISIAIAKALFYKKPDSEIYFVTDQEYADFVKGNRLNSFHNLLARRPIDKF